MQRNIAANAGLGFAGLADLVTTIARRELRRLAGPGRQSHASASAAAGPRRPPAAECEQCAVAEAAASAAEGLAECCGEAGGEADVAASGTILQQLHCVFNLRRALFVLEALLAHDRNVLGCAHAAEASTYASDLRQIRMLVDRFEQAMASD